VGLKKLAPYRPAEAKENDARRYNKKKRLRQWRKKVREEGEDQDIRAMLRPDPPKAEPVEPAERKKKRKSRKGKDKEGDQTK
jgi:protein KRI1